jgi:hypothetical protein
MEGAVWPAPLRHFQEEYGPERPEQVTEFLDPDLSWAGLSCRGPEQAPSGETPAHTRRVALGPLAAAETIAEVEARRWPNPAWWQPGDFQGARRQWPHHALAFLPGWMPLFWSACDALGMQEALIKMLFNPSVFGAFVQRQHPFYGVDNIRGDNIVATCQAARAATFARSKSGPVGNAVRQKRSLLPIPGASERNQEAHR